MFQGIFKSAIKKPDTNTNYIFGTGSIPIQIKTAQLATFADGTTKQQGYQVAEVNKLISTMLTGWDADGNKPKSMSDNYLELTLSCDNGFVVKKRLQFPHIIAWQDDSTPYNIADVYKEFSIDNWLKADDFENPDITLVVEPTDEILTTSTATPPEATTTNSGRFYLYYRNLPVGVNRIHIDFHIKTKTEPIDFDLEVIDGLSWKDAQTILASNAQAKINVLLSTAKDVYKYTGAEGNFEDITMHEWSALYQQTISLTPSNKFTHDLCFYLYEESELNTKITENTKSIQEINESLESTSYKLAAENRIIGKYRVITGSLASNNAYFYTKPIKLHKGDKIIITDANIVKKVSIISEVDSNNNFISVIYAGQGAIASYAFIASKDMLIGLSSLDSQADTIVIETNGVFQRLTADEEDISDLQKTLTDTTRGLETTDVIVGKYRTITGNLSTMAAYFYSDPILLHKGDRIVTTSKITLTQSVSFISKVDADNNFDSTLRAGSGSSSPEIIDYTMAEDSYISISALYDQRTLIVIYQYGIEKRIDDLVSDVASISPAEDTKLPVITDNPLSSIRRDAGFGSIIRKWGIIGDSLSSGEMQCYDNTSTSSSDYKLIDMYQYSWGQQFARLIGADAYNFSNGGQTAWGWLKSQGTIHDESFIGGVGGGDWNLAKQDAYKKDAYIIALGVNDRAKIENGDYVLGATSEIVSYDGTDSDIDDTSVNPKSFVRYYAGIIQRVKSIQPKAKIFCVTPLGSNYAEIAQAIRDIVEYYSSDGVYLIDLYNYIPKEYNVDGYMLNGHLSPMGYTYTAYMINTYIDWIIRNNGSAFRDTALIGTKYKADY